MLRLEAAAEEQHRVSVVVRVVRHSVFEELPRLEGPSASWSLDPNRTYSLLRSSSSASACHPRTILPAAVRCPCSLRLPRPLADRCCSSLYFRQAVAVVEVLLVLGARLPWVVRLSLLVCRLWVRIDR